MTILMIVLNIDVLAIWKWKTTRLCEKKIALKPTFASHLKKDSKHVFGDVDMKAPKTYSPLNGH